MHALVYVITKQRGADIGVITFNTLPIGIAGLGLFVTGLLVEHPDLSLVTANSWAALAYLGLAASVGGLIVYFFLLKRLTPEGGSLAQSRAPFGGAATAAWPSTVRR
ncbi:EamA family transporter [Castellaniella denitrificans]|uniref:EamA family transporter n=1 Tax=Castellaniella denitrificans TaxID=56119 RepID=UPI00362203B8